MMITRQQLRELRRLTWTQHIGNILLCLATVGIWVIGIELFLWVMGESALTGILG